MIFFCYASSFLGVGNVSKLLGIIIMFCPTNIVCPFSCYQHWFKPMRSTVAVAPMASASRHGPLDSKVTAAVLRCPELCEPLLGRGLPGQVTCACAILVTDAGRILCQRRRQGLQCFGGGRNSDC